MQKLAMQANFSSWKNAQEVIQEVVEALSHFSNVSKQLNIKSETSQLMSKQLNSVYHDNKHLLVR